MMTRGPLCEMVPIENASMEDRTVIEWDKDDIDAIGILKVDVLALGMLTCISKGLAMVNLQRKDAAGNPKSEIRNPKSQIRNLKFEISNPNPDSKPKTECPNAMHSPAFVDTKGTRRKFIRTFGFGI